MLEMVHSISIHIPMSEVRQEQFKKETAYDPTLSAICKFYLYGSPAVDKIPERCMPYCKMKDDLYVEAGMVFLEHKIVVPRSL
jgi:hypothetical protein